ncbi:MAG: OmpH family outer membrane protein [Ferruginibacter sp.]
MKQFSSILNIVLLLAVGYLYYAHFSHGKKEKPGGYTSSKHVDSCLGTPVIAYVDLDSLNNNVNYIKQRRKELEQEQNVIAGEYQNAYKELEQEKNNFIKRGNSITQQEADEFQAKLIQRQQQIEAARQSRGQELAQKSAKAMEEMQTNLKSFLNEYNKDKKYSYILATGTGLDYLFFKDSTKNITADVVKGLNERNKKGKP